MTPPNPYWGQNFFGFFSTLCMRLVQWVKGDLSLDQLASDEIQLLVLGLVAISSALVGTFLVLKKMTMLANSLSHTILLGIVLTYLLVSMVTAAPLYSQMSIEVLLIAALITGLVTTLLTQLLTQVMKLQEDASIGLVFTTLFALGIVCVTLFTRNAHIGTELVIGNVDALHFNDVKLISLVTFANLSIIVLFFKEFKIVTFDAALAKSLGISVTFFNYLLMVQTAATSIGAFRSVGVLLVLSFLVGPVLIARLFTHHLKWLLTLGAATGAICSLIGVALSRHLLSVYHMPLSTAGLVVSSIVVVYLLSLLFVAVARRRSWAS